MINFLFYCIYLGAKTPGRKRGKLRRSRKEEAKTFFSALSAFYAVFITVFSLSLLKNTLFHNMSDLVVLFGIFIVGATFWLIPARYFTYNKIEQIDKKYEGQVSLMKSRIIMYALGLSMPLTTLIVILLIKA